jgi:hypothetical protein
MGFNSRESGGKRRERKGGSYNLTVEEAKESAEETEKDKRVNRRENRV